MEVVRKRPLDREERMKPDPVEAAHHENGRWSLAVGLRGRANVGRERGADEHMRSTPSCVTSLSDKSAKRVGTQKSIAMLASTRGPSRKPACAATTRSAASETRVTTTIQWPT